MKATSNNNFRFDENLLVKPNHKVKLKDYDTGYTCGFKDKEDAAEMLELDIKRISELQDKLYASNTYSMLIIFQAIDAAGKDSTIKHVMTGINPQGCTVTSFKQPSAEELEHDFLWRINKAMPSRGMIAIFNRSHYEEVLVTRVHPEFILKQNIPGINSLEKVDHKFWKRRFEIINNFEKTAYENGTIILKFFLYVSKQEQKKRFLERIEKPEKNWKFSARDVYEREFWDKYIEAYEEAISHTSTDFAPWYIIPADKKWFTRAAVGDIIAGTMESLELDYPKLSDEAMNELSKAKQILLNE
jgi:PPK2 family polyphosphate:nucleotide phosphotransferase